MTHPYQNHSTCAQKNHEAKNQEGIQVGRITLSQSKVRQDTDELSKKRRCNPTLKVIGSTRPEQKDCSYNGARQKPAGTPGNGQKGLAEREGKRRGVRKPMSIDVKKRGLKMK